MSQTLKCRVCGKEYVPCKSSNYNQNVFNWREVSCSPECGQIYLERVVAARIPVDSQKAKKVTKRKTVEPQVTEFEIDI